MKYFVQQIENFHIPRYNELPTIELYKDQMLSYIEEVLRPLTAEAEEKPLTTSMVNNYVKQGVVPPTKKKRYSREHIAYLMVICILKQIYSISEISRLITLQNASFDIEPAYNYMCTELENALKCTFNNKPLEKDTSTTNKLEKMLVRNSVIAFSNKLYTQKLSECLYEKLEK